MEDGRQIKILDFLRVLFKLLASSHFGDLLIHKCLLNFFSFFLFPFERDADLQ